MKYDLIFSSFQISHTINDNSARSLIVYSPELCFSQITVRQVTISVPTCWRVLYVSPHFRHRPVLISEGIQIRLVRYFPIPKWNRNIAYWGVFSTRLERGLSLLPLKTTVGLQDLSYLLPKHAFRGASGKDTYLGGVKSVKTFTVNLLSQKTKTEQIYYWPLQKSRKGKWVNTLDFTHSIRKAGLFSEISALVSRTRTRGITARPL